MAKNDDEVISARSFKALGKKIYKFYKSKIEYSLELLSEVKSSDLAMELAGTEDKKSKEYKAALRNVQRYKQGSRKPKADMKRAIERSVKKIRGDQPPKFPPGKITAKGTFFYSEGEGNRKRTIAVEMGASAIAEFVELARDPDDEAGEGPEEFFFDMYDAPGLMMVSGKVTFQETE